MPEFEKQINGYMRARTPLDVQAVYALVKDRFALKLTHAFALENGEADYDADFAMLCGTSPAGSFQLYDNGLYGVFQVQCSDGSESHCHPGDIAEAVDEIIQFMQKNSQKHCFGSAFFHWKPRLKFRFIALLDVGV